MAVFLLGFQSVFGQGPAIKPGQVNQRIWVSNSLYQIRQIQKVQNGPSSRAPGLAPYQGLEILAYMDYIYEELSQTNPPSAANIEANLKTAQAQFKAQHPPSSLLTVSDSINAAFSILANLPGVDVSSQLTNDAATWARTNSSLSDFRAEDQLLAQAGQFYSSTAVQTFEITLLEDLWNLANLSAPAKATEATDVIDSFLDVGSTSSTGFSFGASVVAPGATIISNNTRGFGKLPVIAAIGSMIVNKQISLTSESSYKGQPLYLLAQTIVGSSTGSANVLQASGNVVGVLSQIDQAQNDFVQYLNSSTLQTQTQTMAANEETQDGATIDGALASVYAISGLANYAAEELQDKESEELNNWSEQLLQVGGCSAQMATSLKDFMNSSVAPDSWPGEGATTREGVSLFTSDYAGSILNMFGGLYTAGATLAPGTTDISSFGIPIDTNLISTISGIGSQTKTLSSYLSQRFDRIDTQLLQFQGSINQVFTTLNQDYLNLQQSIQNLQLTENQVLAQVDQVRDGLFVLQSELNTLEADMYELIGAEARIPLYNDINGILDWTIDNQGAMQPSTFFNYYSDLYTWATDDSEQAFAIGPSGRPYDDADLATQLAIYSLDTNTDYLLDQYVQYANSLGANLSPLAVSSPLPNPHDWEISAEAINTLSSDFSSDYSALSKGWTAANPSGTIYAVQDLGQGLETAFSNITLTNGEPNWPLFNFLEQKYQSNQIGFDSAIKAAEADYMASQTLTAYPYPTVNIYDLELTDAFNLYAVRPFWVEFGGEYNANGQQDGAADQQGSVLESDSNMAKALKQYIPSDYMRAEELGLGHVQTYVDLSQNPAANGYVFNVLIQFEPNVADSLYFRPGSQGEDGNNCYESSTTQPVYTIFAGTLAIPSTANAAYAQKYWSLNAETELSTWLADCSAQQRNTFQSTIQDVPPMDEAAVDSEIESATAALQAGEIADILQQFEYVPPTPVTNAVNSITGSKLLFQGFVSLGLSRTLETNDLLKALLSGNQRLPDAQLITQIYTDAQDQLDLTGLPLRTDPESDIDELMSSRLSALTSAVSTRLITIGQTGQPEIPRLVEATMQHISNVIALNQPPLVAPSALVVSPNAIQAGTGTEGKITLRTPAPKGGLWVSVSSSSNLVQVPSTVLVKQGMGWATFPVTTTGTGATTKVTVTAHLDGTAEATLVLSPSKPNLANLDIDSNLLKNKSYEGTVKLAWDAIGSGAEVSLRSSDPSVVAVPASVFVPAGKSQAAFSFKVGSVKSLTTVHIYGIYGKEVVSTVNVAP